MEVNSIRSNFFQARCYGTISDGVRLKNDLLCAIRLLTSCMPLRCAIQLSPQAPSVGAPVAVTVEEKQVRVPWCFVCFVLWCCW